MYSYCYFSVPQWHRPPVGEIILEENLRYKPVLHCKQSYDQ